MEVDISLLLPLLLLVSPLLMSLVFKRLPLLTFLEPKYCTWLIFNNGTSGLQPKVSNVTSNPVFVVVMASTFVM